MRAVRLANRNDYSGEEQGNVPATRPSGRRAVRRQCRYPRRQLRALVAAILPQKWVLGKGHCTRVAETRLLSRYSPRKLHFDRFPVEQASGDGNAEDDACSGGLGLPADRKPAIR